MRSFIGVSVRDGKRVLHRRFPSASAEAALRALMRVKSDAGWAERKGCATPPGATACLKIDEDEGLAVYTGDEGTWTVARTQKEAISLMDSIHEPTDGRGDEARYAND